MALYYVEANSCFHLEVELSLEYPLLTSFCGAFLVDQLLVLSLMLGFMAVQWLPLCSSCFTVDCIPPFSSSSHYSWSLINFIGVKEEK